jgi:ribonuclease E
MRSVSSVSLQVLRALEDTLIKGATHNILVRTRAEVALYLLNHKRAHLRELEQRFRITITVDADPTVGALQPFVIDRGEQVHSVEAAKAIAAQPESIPATVAEDEEVDEVADDGDEDEEDLAGIATNSRQAEAAHDDGSRRRRRRRRRGRRDSEGRDGEAFARPDVVMPTSGRGEDHDEAAAGDDMRGSVPEAAALRARSEDEQRGEGDRNRRRRGRRGGRRNRRGREGRPEAPYGDAVSGPEPELDRAVAALDTGPAQPEHEPFVSRALEPTPGETIRQPSEPPPAEPELPRRRSTVREPAPFVGGGDWTPPAPPPMPAPPPDATPVAADSGEADDSSKPRRSGWWSRRIAGGG